MAGSFDAKVEALRRLRDKRRAREAASEEPSAQSLDHQAEAAAEGTCSVDAVTRGDMNSAGAAATSASPFAALGGASADEARPDPAGQGGEGEMDALFCTGHCYERGLHGCAQDNTMAAHFYRIAAEGGHATAQWRLGELCEFGRGVPQNDEEAASWYRRAAETGHKHAQSGLALLLEEGRGVAQDNPEALRLHLEAAAAGHALSQYCAGRCLAEGRGAPQDLAEAHRWLECSAAAGFQPAMAALAVGTDVDAEPPDVGEGAGTREDDSSMLGLAQRLARQLQDLDDADAELLLDELLADAPVLLGNEASFELPPFDTDVDEEE
mmetsp:Transcript_38598/g.106283  ORF Transcript_38598/g.106283 Transcript_38598/m.106283 type:complete len:324 (-) Transcript_38598:115-1086(-)